MSATLDGVQDFGSDPGWTLAPHVCRACYGRILIGPGGLFKCSGCERESLGGCTSICGCGLSKRKSPTGAPIFKCTANPDRATFPAAFVIVYGERVIAPIEAPA